MDDRTRRAWEIYSAINDILYAYWDPIGFDEALPKDEYEGYVGAVYRAITNGKSEQELVALLTHIENERIGLRVPWLQKVEAARRLVALNIKVGV
jgi:hypothetical protein